MQCFTEWLGCVFRSRDRSKCYERGKATTFLRKSSLFLDKGTFRHNTFLICARRIFYTKRPARIGTFNSELVVQESGRSTARDLKYSRMMLRYYDTSPKITSGRNLAETWYIGGADPRSSYKPRNFAIPIVWNYFIAPGDVSSLCISGHGE